MIIPLTTPARKYRLYGLLLCGAGLYFFANFQRVAIPGAEFDLLQMRFHATASQVTALGAVFMYVYAAAQLFVGLLVDRYGGVRTICGGGLLFCAGSLLFALADTLPVLYLGRALTGLGAAALYLSLIKETIRTFPGKYAIMISVMIMIGYAGGIVANAPFAGAVAAWGLTPAMLAAAGCALGCYGGFALLGGTLKLPPVQAVPLHPGNFREVCRTASNRHVFGFSGINFGLYYVIQTVIGKKFLEDYFRIAPLHAAWVLSLLGVIAAVSGFLLALLSRRMGDRRRIFCLAAGWVDLAVFGAMSGILLLDWRHPALAAILCFPATVASMSAITIPLLKESNPAKLTGSAVALMNFSFFLAVAVFGNAVGFLLSVFAPERLDGVLVYSRQSYFLVFAMLTLFAAVSAGFALKIPETSARGGIEPGVE